MSTSKPLPTEQDLLDSPIFQQYVEARGELLRLAPFIQLSPECKTYEGLFQRYISPRIFRA